MRLNDRLIGVLAMLGGLAILWEASGFRSVPGQAYGSAFFPSIVGGLLVTAGLLQVALAKPRVPVLRLADWLRSRRAFAALAMPAGVVLWLLAVPEFGFLATSWVVLSGLMIVLGAAAVRAVTVALVATCLLFLVFSMLLRVPLPRGVIEGVLP